MRIIKILLNSVRYLLPREYRLKVKEKRIKEIKSSLDLEYALLCKFYNQEFVENIKDQEKVYGSRSYHLENIKKLREELLALLKK